MGQGKRHLVCSEVVQAVKCFEEATKKLYVFHSFRFVYSYCMLCPLLVNCGISPPNDDTLFLLWFTRHIRSKRRFDTHHFSEITRYPHDLNAIVLSN